MDQGGGDFRASRCWRCSGLAHRGGELFGGESNFAIGQLSTRAFVLVLDDRQGGQLFSSSMKARCSGFSTVTGKAREKGLRRILRVEGVEGFELRGSGIALADLVGIKSVVGIKAIEALQGILRAWVMAASFLLDLARQSLVGIGMGCSV